MAGIPGTIVLNGESVTVGTTEAVIIPKNALSQTTLFMTLVSGTIKYGSESIQSSKHASFSTAGNLPPITIDVLNGGALYAIGVGGSAVITVNW